MKNREIIISSVQNPRIKDLCSNDLYLWFEGERLCKDLLRQKGFQIEVLIGTSAGLSGLSIPFSASIKTVLTVSSAVMMRLSELKTPPPVMIATLQKPARTEFSAVRSLLALVNVQDPGNTGTLIRTAAAFGIDGVALIGPSVHLTNRKLLRSAQNAIYAVSFSVFDDIKDFLTKCKRYHLNTYFTSSKSSKGSLIQGPESMQPPCAIVLGNEGQGLDQDFFSQYPSVKIPQLPGIDSLNVAVSGSILMHELRKKWGYE